MGSISFRRITPQESRILDSNGAHVATSMAMTISSRAAVSSTCTWVKIREGRDASTSATASGRSPSASSIPTHCGRSGERGVFSGSQVAVGFAKGSLGDPCGPGFTLQSPLRSDFRCNPYRLRSLRSLRAPLAKKGGVPVG